MASASDEREHRYLARWHIRLGGPEAVLSALPQYFRSSRARIFREAASDDRDAYFLESEQLDILSDSWDVSLWAERILHVVNFFVQFSLRSPERVSARLVHPVAPNGTRGTDILIPTGTLYPSFAPSKDAAEKLLRAAESPDNYAAIAFLITGLDDYRSLYAALEAAQLSAGKALLTTTKKADLIREGANWIERQVGLTNDEQQGIKDTAHSFETAGIQARHAPDSSRSPPSRPVPISTARLQLARLVLRLLKLL